MKKLIMNEIFLSKREHHIKVGKKPAEIKPNIIEDTIFYENDKAIGLYLKNCPKKIEKFISISNVEFNSKRVPKTLMSR